jgi:penicillin amidase
MERPDRLHQLIQQTQKPLTLEAMQRIQGDNQTPLARFLLPELLRLSSADSRLQRSQQLLRDWDQQYRQDQAAPSILGMVWKQLLANTFRDELPEAYWPEGHDRWIEVVRQQLKQPNSPWWDNQSTDTVERRDDILRQSFEDAIIELEQRFGTDSRWWRWGALHQASFTHQTLGKSGIPPLEALFNRGPVPVSGGRGIVNANVWDASRSFAVNSIPSLRMVVDFNASRDSVMVHLTGQSDHAFHLHYTDQMELWQRMDYHPMNWEAEKIVATATKTLVLVPEP